MRPALLGSLGATASIGAIQSYVLKRTSREISEASAGRISRSLEAYVQARHPADARIIGNPVNFERIGGPPPLRQAYVNDVKVLEDVALTMREAGASSEQVARQLHHMRRELGVRYKDLTPAPQLERIYSRNLENTVISWVQLSIGLDLMGRVGSKLLNRQVGLVERI